MSDELKKRLGAWRSTPTAQPDAQFADTLERDLRSQAHFAPRSAAKRPLLRPAVLVFSSAAVLLGVWFAVQDTSSSPEEVVMSRPTDTEITLPGQAPTRPTNQVTLPDGTRIAVEDDGSAVVDGVVLDGGTEALVEDGRIEIFPANPTPMPAPPATPTATAGPAASSLPAPTPEPTPEGAPRVTPTPAPTATVAPAPDPTTAPASPQIDPGPILITLGVQNLDGPSLLLTWLAEPRGDVSGWEVVLLSGDRQRSIALLRDSTLRELEVERPDAENVQYIVRARGQGGAVLGESNAAG